ncbi:hypothetical protein [Pseudosulfitobacter koreensis]|uniref:Uncharacterized protein n=1 Tax=Pseudosulfitobacter koreensis TaxID=2968472 RepID=A0ABT1YWC6_9RHOB|nr:hypothetical protein [Pseudosulfitobacter koreense]MCR8825169.1 hypothetical protein [Pseudosulfitobacter koreense]
MRGLLVALMIATPALVLPWVSADSTQVILLTALLAAALVFVEYNSNFPSIVEFRNAPPLNRLRFCGTFVTVFLLTVICAGRTEPTLMTGAMTSVARLVGHMLDFPFSPVRLVILSMPAETPEDTLRIVRAAAGLSYLLSLVTAAVFVVMVRLFGWPSSRNGAFNVWINLPLFDPTAGGDALTRLQRDARINIVLGFLLPFVLPAIAKLAGNITGPITLQDSQTLIWTMTLWAFLPASLLMRGIAMGKVAEMIEEKRRRSYAREAENDYQVA